MGGLKQQEYEDALEPLLRELSDAARWIQETGQRLMVVFEGRDTAGKGGSIHMFANTLNPRQCHVVALPASSERERGQWYFQRYTQHMPAKGEISLFDRSWYNRAGVETESLFHLAIERRFRPDAGGCWRAIHVSGHRLQAGSCIH